MPALFSSPSRLRRSAALAACALLFGACGANAPTSRLRATPAPIRVDWSDPGLSVDAGGGWTVERCNTEHLALCVSRDGTATGHILLEDLPSIGEELTASQDQVQATLAVRTQTIYRELRRHRSEQCGEDYRVDTGIPKPAPVAGITGLAYEATGSKDGRVVERTLGFRVFRDGIETLMEATAIEPGVCLVPEDPTFTVAELRSFQDVLSRIVAGSVLPEATEYPDLPEQLGGSQDPRLDRRPTNGIGISHGLGSRT
ncbi:MAG TPA: hypothetical protein VHI31_05905 [Actinomycetota bacterium]|nr:hypothetical protein [Actinomycetota bacterium]